MRLKKKNNPTFLFISIFFLIIFSLVTFKSESIKYQIHSVSEWIISQDLGFSSFFNMIDDGSILYRGNYIQPVTDKLSSLFFQAPKIIKNELFSDHGFQTPTIYLDIKFKNFEKLLEDRKLALDAGHAILIDFQEVKADLILDGIEKKIKISLKGLLDTHWMIKRRMSFKIKVLNDDTVLGFKEFSIQRPRERQWPYNYVFENISDRLDLLSTESKLVKVIVNGEDWGVMLAEESIGKIYLENQQKLNSLIFKFGDEREWFEGWSGDPLMIYRRSDPSLIFKVYNQQKFLKEDPNSIFRKRISYVLNQREFHSKDLFNDELMAEAFTLSALWGNFHNLLNNNTAYYLNPYTLKLEPIIRDQYPFDPVSSKENIQQWPPPYQFLISLENLNNQYLVDYADNLKKEIPFVKSKFLDAKRLFPIDKLKQTEIFSQNIETFLNKKDSFFSFDSKKYIKNLSNGALLDKYQIESLDAFQRNNKAISTNQLSRFTDLVYIRHYTDGELKVFNLVPDDILIEGIYFNGDNIIQSPFIVENYLTSNDPLIIETEYEGIQDNMFTVHAKYKNHHYQSSNDLSLFKDIPDPFHGSNIPLFFQKNGNDWILESGSWQIDEKIFIHGNLIIENGVELYFADQASLIIEGSIIANGTDQSPIIFDGQKNSWQGLYVLNSSEKSILKNTIFRNTSGISRGILNLTGGVIFYNTDISMDNVVFENTSAEDALNIIDSDYSLQNLYFSGSRSDAFDSDYSNGVIDKINFKNIGGDALDFSGSRVTVKNFFAENVRDKAISVGEASEVEIYGIQAKDIGVAIASKDGSITHAENCYVENYQLSGFMTYIKKNNYSSPSLKLENCVTSSEISEYTFFRQQGTLLSTDNFYNIAERDLDVDLLYESEVMKK